MAPLSPVLLTGKDTTLECESETRAVRTLNVSLLLSGAQDEDEKGTLKAISDVDRIDQETSIKHGG